MEMQKENKTPTNGRKEKNKAAPAGLVGEMKCDKILEEKKQRKESEQKVEVSEKWYGIISHS